MTRYEFKCEKCGGVITHLCEHEGVWTCPDCDEEYSVYLVPTAPIKQPKKKKYYISGLFEMYVHAYNEKDARDLFYNTLGHWLYTYDIEKLWETDA